MFPNMQNNDASISFVTNPHGFSLNGVTFLGTSGQNIKDIRMYASAMQDKALDVIELTLQMRHMFPTTPDTLRSYPFIGEDPFVLHDAPHVYFCGNQPEYGSRLLHTDMQEVTRLISVPTFRSSKSIVLLDTQTLQAYEYKFTAGSLVK